MPFPDHISDDDLMLYALGLIKDEKELARLEECLLWCHACLERLELIEAQIRAQRARLGRTKPTGQF